MTMTNFFSSNYKIFKIPEAQFTTFYPNSCSSGCLLKTKYLNDNNEVLYIKLSHKAKNNMWRRESLFEVICYRIGKALGLPVLEYIPCLIDLLNGSPPEFGCYSMSYIKKGDISLTARNICEANFGLYSTTGNNLRKLGYSDFIDKLIAWDYIIGNCDRHENNIEFICHLDGSVDPAPIFDNGKSLLETYAAYPGAYKIDQISNNFLTYQHLFRTFSEIKAPVKLNSFSSICWENVKKDIADNLTEEEWSYIKVFVERNYTTLAEKGLII